MNPTDKDNALARLMFDNMIKIPVKKGKMNSSELGKWFNRVKMESISSRGFIYLFFNHILFSRWWPDSHPASDEGIFLKEHILVVTIIQRLLSVEDIFICEAQLRIFCKAYAKNKEIMSCVNSRFAKFNPKLGDECLKTTSNAAIKIGTSMPNILGWGSHMQNTKCVVLEKARPIVYVDDSQSKDIIPIKDKKQFSPRAFLNLVSKNQPKKISNIIDIICRKVEEDPSILHALLHDCIDKLMKTFDGTHLAKLIIDTFWNNNKHLDLMSLLNLLLKKYRGASSTVKYCEDSSRSINLQKIALTRGCIIYAKYKYHCTMIKEKYNINETARSMLLDGNKNHRYLSSKLIFSITYHSESYFFVLFNEVLKRKNSVLIRDNGNIMLSDLLRELLEKEYNKTIVTHCDNKQFLRYLKYFKLLCPSFDVNSLRPKCMMCNTRFQDSMCMTTCECDSSYAMCKECVRDTKFCYSCENDDIEYKKIYTSNGKCCTCGERSTGNTCKSCMSDLCSDCSSNCECCKSGNICSECPICLEPKDILFFGCGHMTYCGDCQQTAVGTKHLMKCSICREECEIVPKILKNLANSIKLPNKLP